MHSFAVLQKATMWATMDEANIPMHLTGTAISIVTLIAIYVPDAVMPLVNGWLLDTFADDLPKAYSNYFTILISMAFIAALAAISIFVRHKKLKKKKLQTSAKE